MKTVCCLADSSGAQYSFSLGLTYTPDAPDKEVGWSMIPHKNVLMKSWILSIFP